MGNKNTIIQFVRDKGFYIALAVCIVGASAAAWATASRTLDSIEKNNRQIVLRQSSAHAPTFHP